MVEMSRKSVANNPLVFLHVNHLLSMTDQLPAVEHNFSASVLNEAIADKGLFLIQCSQMVIRFKY